MAKESSKKTDITPPSPAKLRAQKIVDLKNQLEVLELRALVIESKVKIAEGQARLKKLTD